MPCKTRGSTNPHAVTGNLPAHPVLLSSFSQKARIQIKSIKQHSRAVHGSCSPEQNRGFWERVGFRKRCNATVSAGHPASRNSKSPCQSTLSTAVCWAFRKKKKKEAVTLLRWLKIKFFCKKRKSRLALHASSCGRRQQAGSAVGQGMAGRIQPVPAAPQVFSE